MTDSDRWHAHEFLRIFQDSRSDLEARIVSAKNAAPAIPTVVNDLAQDLARLSKSLADGNDKLPTYDQRQLGLQVKAMETMIEELRAASTPKPKFAFRRTVVPGLDVPQRPPPKTNTDNVSSENISAPSNKAQHAILSSQSYRYISPTDLLSTDQPSSELTISGLDHCIVNLIGLAGQCDNGIQLSTVHVKNVSHSVLILPIINGSILLNDLTHCVIAVGCHQFRMHNSRKVHVYLSITSNPVIEHCSEIGFVAYPDIPGHHVNKENNHLAVQDFSHIRSSPSPHWFALQSDSILKSWPTAEIQDRSRMEEMLPTLLPPPT